MGMSGLHIKHAYFICHVIIERFLILDATTMPDGVYNTGSHSGQYNDVTVFTLITYIYVHIYVSI